MNYRYLGIVLLVIFVIFKMTLLPKIGHYLEKNLWATIFLLLAICVALWWAFETPYVAILVPAGITIGWAGGKMIRMLENMMRPVWRLMGNMFKRILKKFLSK